jgi:hypothetical protein
MRVVIEKITGEKHSLVVSFSSDFGNATAFWSGEDPSINHEYQVEVDIDHSLEWGKDVVFCTDDADCIQQESNSISISGSIDSIDEDGYTIIKLGENIIPFMANCSPILVGTRITLSVKSISLSPVDY